MGNSFSSNPFSLFLILILLILSTDKSADVKLGFVRGLVDQTSRSLSMLREGLDSMHASFNHVHTVFNNQQQNPEQE